MHYYSESDIRSIVESVVVKAVKAQTGCQSVKKTIPVEVSARHVHLTQAAIDQLFGKGYQLKKKRELSQPGQYLAEERLKIVTAKGEFANVAILGPARPRVQVELSQTDAKVLGIAAPVRLSGDLNGAADVLLIGPKGFYQAVGSAMVAKAHVHMLPEDAKAFGVTDGQTVNIKIQAQRPIVLCDVAIRVTEASRLALHVDFDEANAAAVSGNAVCVIV